MHKAIFIDIDGTLRNDDREITYKTKEAIKNIREKGILVILCSGRPIKTTLEISEESCASNYIITSNGAYGYNYIENKCIFKNPMRINDCLEIYKIAKERHNSGGKNYFENGENEFLKEAINIAIKRDIEEIKEARANKENSVDEIKKLSKTEEQNIPEKVETIKPLTKESIINGINPREGEIIKFTKAIKELKLNERANEQNQKENIDFEK